MAFSPRVLSESNVNRLITVVLVALLAGAIWVSAQTLHAPTGVHVAAALNPAGGSTAIEVGATWQTAIDAGNSGQVFVIRAGTHRLQSISPKAGQVFIGEAGAIMSGAKVLESASFVTAGSFWKITGQTQAMGTRAGECQMTSGDGYTGTATFATSYPGCTYREELFYDNVRKVHVQTLGEMGAGEWFFNYDTDEIYVGDNPSGHVVETSVTAAAFNPTASNVSISNLTIEKYATPAQYGAINAENAQGWVVADNLIRLNHGAGIRYGPQMKILRNTITYNGQEGLIGVGDDTSVEDNEIAYNNGAHFDPTWEAGGTKFVLSDHLTVRGNFVHHNEGPGLWTDIDNNHVLFDNNTVEDNDQVGILHEISWAATIQNNTVRRNGLAAWVPSGYVWGVGILVSSSKDVEVLGNTVEDNLGGIAGVQQARGTGTLGAHQILNLNVHNNSVKQSSGLTGLVQDIGDTSYFTSKNNHFSVNTYLLHTNTNYFAWNDVSPSSFTTWQGYSNDTAGSVTTY